ncbi:MAG: hypothetical protein A3G32_02275 [Deltaproteobacteria bacterium RIFCSPLOWO2_12_FULL_40_28]|nr:MAG: hypothetical protein A3C45_02955 [Deltaproteobacteria bacterium RIFCSPHIGHO2_02_FULL_40_28]OGQ20654.1 MAG: hypothetical protein A3E27_10065 [Deltaproteobacteria bacterium RIFCSPHIGHO2_12_FULL_40_32]OGQ38889.1 MAG: hypothetical protein A3I69_08285 [Deltaproteobacteria bacterium RIFCSPLOWO2_02_FULL_40_36]OGQ55248.1 MAG: hypothetical protein A3G32_02275 [Deltaproteobacteria bacterium RIFCSPLOWO2_12_FULL_40_28]
MKKFLARWFQTNGVLVDEIPQKVHNAILRIKRLPWPVRWVYPVVVALVEWVFPLFLFGKLSRASCLSSSDFEGFQSLLHHHRIFWVRLSFLLVRMPLWDQVWGDQKPSLKKAHPLQGRLTYTVGQNEWDVIVIGSGAGGAPVASRLAQKGYRVVVVEAGDLVEPQTTSYTIEHYFYKQGCTISTSKGIVLSLAGSTVGGTTPVNSGTCFRPTSLALQEWDQLLNTCFATSGELDPYFEEVEKILGVYIPDRSLLGNSAYLFEKGLERMGRKGAYVLARNAPGCEGSGRCCFVCPTGSKNGTDRSFLPLAISAGAQILARSYVTKVTENKDGVTVCGLASGSPFFLKAKKLVIAGGAFESPKLLRTNHLGKYWRRAGDCFKTHPASKVFALFDEPVYGGHGIPQSLGYRAPELPRVVFEGIFTPPSAAAPLIQAVGARHRFWMERYDYVASFAFLLAERASGKVSFLHDWPLIRHPLMKEDVHDIVCVVKLIGEAFFHAGAKKVLLPLAGIINEFDSLEQLQGFDPRVVKTTQVMTSGFHPQGTAGMGRVVDTNLKLMGTNHVYLCDASVLPLSPRVNPQITIMGLSLRLADHMLIS